MLHPNSRNLFKHMAPPTYPLAPILNGNKGHAPHLPPFGVCAHQVVTIDTFQPVISKILASMAKRRL